MIIWLVIYGRKSLATLWASFRKDFGSKILEHLATLPDVNKTKSWLHLWKLMTLLNPTIITLGLVLVET